MLRITLDTKLPSMKIKDLPYYKPFVTNASTGIVYMRPEDPRDLNDKRIEGVPLIYFLFDGKIRVCFCDPNSPILVKFVDLDVVSKSNSEAASEDEK